MQDDQPDTSASLPATIQSAVSEIGPSGWRMRFAKLALKIVGSTALYEVAIEAGDRYSTLEGRHIVAKKMAEAVANRISKDPEQVERAIDRFYGEAARKQENLESIVQRSAEHVAQIEYKPERREGSEEEPPATEPSADWRAKFVNYAADVSEPQMQDLWARILAGEFKAPGSYSYRTMRLVSEMDKEIAEAFAEIGKYQFGHIFLLLEREDWSKGQNLYTIKGLQDFGLILATPGTNNWQAKKDERNIIWLFGRSTGAMIYAPSAPESIAVPVTILTSAGRQLIGLLPPENDRALLEKLCLKLKGRVGSDSFCVIGKRVDQGNGRASIDSQEILWGEITDIPPA